MSFIFEPYQYQSQLNDLVLDDLDGDQYTDLLFIKAVDPDLHIFEYNPNANNFDSVYRFDVMELPPYSNSGFSVGDFDIDGKKDMVFGTPKGSVYVLENQGDNQYNTSWVGSVQSYHAYIHTWTNDIDGNGKPEFWVLADAYYSGIGTTRITIFETNGDNSYQAVGRIDLVGVFSFYAGTMQAIDIDHDGTEEVAICIDGNFLILKFVGNANHQIYQLYYIKKEEEYSPGEWITYFGATMNDLLGDGKNEILISLIHIIEQPGDDWGRFETRIYRPDSTTDIKDNTPNLNYYQLYQNYPNPFNPVTNLTFNLARSTNVSIKIYNILGKEIKTLLEKELTPGSYTISWEARDGKGQLLPSGVYLIRFSATGGADYYTKTNKAILMK